MPYASGRHAEQLPGQNYVREGTLFYVTQKTFHDLNIAINQPNYASEQPVKIVRMLTALGWDMARINHYIGANRHNETRLVVDIDLVDEGETPAPFTLEELDAMEPRVARYALSIVFNKNNHFKTVADVRRETRLFAQSL